MTLSLAIALLAGLEASEQRLVFEFPDGVRGGTGQIQGMAPVLREWPADFALNRIKACGARDARPSSVQATHRYLIESVSTRHDRKVVGCVKRSVPFHFSAFNPSTDFPEFWTLPVMQGAKIN